MLKKTIILISFLCISILPSCKSCFKSGEKDRLPIKIALSTWPGYAHAFIAKENGYFLDNGVDVDLLFTREYSDALKLFTEKKVDGVFEVFSEAIFHNSQGVPTKVVYITDYSTSGDVIIAHPNIKSILDLKDKPVGIDGINAFSHLFVLTRLLMGGLKEEDIRFEIVPAQTAVDALLDGRVSAVHTWEPAKSGAIKKGYKVIASAGDIPGIITDVLVFHEDVSSKKRNEVKGIIRALFQALEFIKTNRSEAIEIMARSENMTPQEVDSGLNGIFQPDKESNISAMKKRPNDPNRSGPESLFTIAKRIYEFFGKRGRYFNEKDLDSIIDPSFLE